MEVAWLSDLGCCCCNPEARDLFCGSPGFKSSVILCKWPAGIGIFNCYVYLKCLFPLFQC